MDLSECRISGRRDNFKEGGNTYSGRKKLILESKVHKKIVVHLSVIKDETAHALNDNAHRCAVRYPRILRYDVSLRCQSEQSDRVLRLDQRSKQERLSFGSSIQYVCEPDSLNGTDGKSIVHMNPIVL
ncbi:hypothetical protein L5515_001459 [Caenorhabditis briggsae]|uniref:Uncharacterized protein n=1 Tax=Caenorhabditis briggsae TaxID=6238 RepID=A0AAE9J3R6_CAEBR|nr:hypothetical protein L5515_001459 [Caenorhabditis briggsae]